ncbi:hypothetical protein [Planctomicrobium piriforme]|uniref:Uncharacterized protein n=1 Tax=Planctomicrobium piriforme TaxID=1576369 RepID=A0A1I3CEE4_9PLAN|nr:hypothetical protein [Planctomicrobium piriforme]SFH72887.1 hypothetical protein SAMN05421753_102246 [Planctomicrobium piriforme]
MLRWFALYSLLTVAVSSNLLADTPPETEQETPVARLAEAPMPLPYSYDAVLTQAPTLTATEHLQEAVRHLQEAGFPEDAARIQRQLDEVLETKLSELATKRKQIEDLKASVAALELEVGAASQYLVECISGELDLTTLHRNGGSWNSLLDGDGKKKLLLDDELLISSGPVDREKCSVLLGDLFGNGTAKVLTDVRLAAIADQPQAYVSGINVPVIQQTTGGTPLVGYQPVGEVLTATVTPVGGNKVRVKFSLTLSMQTARTISTADGRQIPEIDSHLLQAEVELKPDQTMLLVSPMQNKDGQVLWFAAVNVSPLRPHTSKAVEHESEQPTQVR